MTINKFDYEWAESGAKTPAPSDAKIQTGWVSGAEADRAYTEYFNFLQNRAEAKINRIVQERLDSFYEGATDPQAMITTGLWDEPWGMMYDTLNTIETGATKEIRDIAIYFDGNNNPHLLIIDASVCKIEVWNPRTLLLEDTSDALTDDLPSGGGQTWEPYSICTDGTHVYAMFRDTNAAPDTHQIQSWLISDWSVNAGWAATGTALTGTGNGSSTYMKDGKIINATSTKLACACGWNTITAINSAAISIVDKTDGTIDASGAGDASTTDSLTVLPSLCSDGTNIFFLAYHITNGLFTCSATIADPTDGCGGANYPLDNGVKHSGTILACGPNQIISFLGIGGGIAASNVVIRTHNATDADLDVIYCGQNSYSTPLVCDYIMRHVESSFFDGINAWVVADIDIASSGIHECLLKIDIAKLKVLDVNSERQLLDVLSGAFQVNPSEYMTSSTRKYWSVIGDGRDIWCNYEGDASQTDSGKLFRLPLALLRS